MGSKRQPVHFWSHWSLSFAFAIGSQKLVEYMRASFYWLRVGYFHQLFYYWWEWSEPGSGDENRMSTAGGACEYKIGVVGCGGIEICRRGRWGVWVQTVLSFTWTVAASGVRCSFPFIHLVPFLCWILIWTKADGESDSEWPDARDSRNGGGERSHETGGSMETTEQNEMCRWTDALGLLGTGGDGGKNEYLKRKAKENVVRGRTVCVSLCMFACPLGLILTPACITTHKYTSAFAVDPWECLYAYSLCVFSC